MASGLCLFRCATTRLRRVPGLVRVRPTLHWVLFAVIVAPSVVTLYRIEGSESSTAGFGLVVVPLLLTLAVLLAAVIHRSSKRPHTEPDERIGL